MLVFPNFDRRLDLFNALRAENTQLLADGIVVVTELLHVLRLYELGVYRVVALPSEQLYTQQLACIKRLVGEGGAIDLAPSSEEYVDILAALLPHFHVRLHRYEGSEDECLSQVANSMGW